ncbi:hypothetical protein BJ912DRAFT_1060294 [Pholiota molesta]|nr:hypothetical protein BJ912DRAFT_1060294 [Pholiota molesta]
MSAWTGGLLLKLPRKGAEEPATKRLDVVAGSSCACALHWTTSASSSKSLASYDTAYPLPGVSLPSQDVQFTRPRAVWSPPPPETEESTSRSLVEGEGDRRM